MPDPWTDLLGCLDLAADPDAATFVGRNQQLEYHRVFCGQLLAQFLRIASLTCPDKAVKSQHAVFAREGRADEHIRYEAIRNHEGRSFAALTITARQSRGVVATASISMHTVEDGPGHQEIADVPEVLGLRALHAEFYGPRRGVPAARVGRQRRDHVRHLPPSGID